MRRECVRRGEDAVIAGCIALLKGEEGEEGDEVDPELIYALGGPPARWAITGGESGPTYWLRVWAARGLLYAYDQSASGPIIDALSDEHWRVREMAAKVCGRHRVEDALPQLSDLARDPRVRVQRAAERAAIRITTTQ
ncbi:hypothetical protein GCM10007269_36660 [Microbacterium murale]|uniref:HEAT repeat domain-containing protein n=1 Tax=Microbacterium murale TaxID=1081040 RepID=A0ABQ1S693_9MICO|nr:hypothetical protein GCM10007269_36660 [Microbacterium murale]